MTQYYAEASAPSKPDDDGRTVAAVDLGSNSFHMMVARWVKGRFHVLDRLRERVRLAEGLTGHDSLTEVAEERALACLERFGQRLCDMPADAVRAVGTNALRQANDTPRFLQRAQEALGHEIHVIPGAEEARLIYLGVARHHGDDTGRRLVVDIGGGSTECIVGEGSEILEWASLHMGCVSYSERFFPAGEITRAGMQAARVAANLDLRLLARRLRDAGWNTALGCSGTAVAIARILEAAGWDGPGITPRGLKRLRRALRSAGHVSALDLPGLAEDRAAVLPGGVAILTAVFDRLKIESMSPAGAALREGLLYDVLGRLAHDDPREETIRHMQTTYHVDEAQSKRVERLALALFDQVRKAWGLSETTDRDLLAWAARVHETGLAISRSGYHKHGAYLLENSDMPGFARDEQQTLAALVRGHRRKLRGPAADGLGPSELKLCVLLRLAHRLNRSRSSSAPVAIGAKAGKGTLALTFPEGWLREHPLTTADLAEEAGRQADVGIRLDFA